jgi:hypothetical protein
LKYGGHDNLELSRKIELLKSITSYDQCTVGEFVPEHHEYFRLNYNHNPLDCCNLNIRRIWLDEEQLELELKTDGTK